MYCAIAHLVSNWPLLMACFARTSSEYMQDHEGEIINIDHTLSMRTKDLHFTINMRHTDYVSEQVNRKSILSNHGFNFTSPFSHILLDPCPKSCFSGLFPSRTYRCQHLPAGAFWLPPQRGNINSYAPV